MGLKNEDLESVDFIDVQEREYFAQAHTGEEVRNFLLSTAGRYLHGCAKQEIETYRDALEKCNPDSLFGRRKIRRLQKKAEAARMFMRWCTEAIQTGEYAYQQLEEYRR